MNAPTPALVARPERLRLVGQRRQILAVDAPAADVRDAGLCRRHRADRRCGSCTSRRSATMPAARSGITTLIPERGDIVDRDGQPLARTIDAWTIAHPPDEGHRRQARARARARRG